MPSTPPAEITGLYRYPVKGPHAGAAAAGGPEGRPDASRRPPLRHRERPRRVRSAVPTTRSQLKVVGTAQRAFAHPTDSDPSRSYLTMPLPVGTGRGKRHQLV